MATQMQKAISGCKWCIQYEGIHAKVPMQPIIETMIELDQCPNRENLLVFCDHFTKHIMAY